MELLDICTENPDWPTLLVYSDYLEDQDRLAEAEALRWLHRNQCWPTHQNWSSWFYITPPHYSFYKRKERHWLPPVFAKTKPSRCIFQVSTYLSVISIGSITLPRCMEYFLEAYTQLKLSGELTKYYTTNSNHRYKWYPV